MDISKTLYFSCDAEPLHLGGRQALTPYVLSDHLAPQPFVAPPACDRYLWRHGPLPWASAQVHLFESTTRPHAENYGLYGGGASSRREDLVVSYSLLSTAIKSNSAHPWGDVRCVRHDDDHWTHFGVVSSRTACEVGVIEAAQQELLSRLQANAAGERAFCSRAEVERLYARIREARAVLRGFHLNVVMANIESWKTAAQRGSVPNVEGSWPQEELSIDQSDPVASANRAILEACATVNYSLSERTKEPQKLWQTWWRRTDERFERFWGGHAAGIEQVLACLDTKQNREDAFAPSARHHLANASHWPHGGSQ